MQAVRSLGVCLFATIVAVALVTACAVEPEGGGEAKPAAGPAKTASVEVFNDAFQPNTVTIATNGTVTWKNRAQVKYSVTCDGHFDQVLDPGTTWQFTFQAAGTYPIYDRMQANAPQMTVIVQ